VVFDLKLAAVLVNLCPPDIKDEIGKNIATHALLTMGSKLRHFETKIVNGVIKVNHTFVPITETYENELELKTTTDDMRNAGIDYSENYSMTDHLILWLYRVRVEKPTGKDGVVSNETDCPNRTYLIGSVALNTSQLLNAATISTEPSPRPSFVVKHNFMDTSIICEVCMSNFDSQDRQDQLTTIKRLNDLSASYAEKTKSNRAFDEAYGLVHKQNSGENPSHS
jgi:hypothetical protein